MMLTTAMYKVFLTGVLPLLSLACLWFAVLFLFRGIRSLLLRCIGVRQGLHASSVLKRHNEAGELRFVPVFSYTTARGDEVDILGSGDFASESDALQAQRPLVFASERPDVAVATSPATYIARPVAMLLLSAFLLVVAHFLLQLMPD